MKDHDVPGMAWRFGLIGLISVLTGTLLPGAASAVEPKPEWGTVSADNAVLKPRCRNYPYSYTVTAPEDGYWDLNVSLVGPGGRVLWFGYLSEDANPDTGTATFRLCRSETRPGRFRLKAVVSVQDNNDNIAGKLDTARFRLRKAR